MGLVVIMNCGAGTALHGFEISMFYTHIQRYTAAVGTKFYKNNVNNTFPESRYVKDYENVKLVSLSSC